MLRRFLLVGLYVCRPYHQGSIMQLAVANLTSVLYFAIQLQAMPYKSLSDNYLALGCSLLREGASRVTTRRSPLRWAACTTPQAPRWPAGKTG